MNAAAAILASCIGCGCDDFNACDDGCFWLRVDYAESKGVCSRCAEFEAQWDAGDRTPHAQPVREIEQLANMRIERPLSRRPLNGLGNPCPHDWPYDDVRDADQCRWCGMGFLRHVFTECP